MVEDIRDGVIRAGKIFGCANFIYSEGNPVSKARRPPPAASASAVPPALGPSSPQAQTRALAPSPPPQPSRRCPPLKSEIHRVDP